MGTIDPLARHDGPSLPPSAGTPRMPYRSNADLPPRLRRVLPEHAQDTYRAAFNNAWLSRDRQGDEATMHRIAWAAVKRGYRKFGDRWVPRQ